jgi:hypothetical protein
MWHLELTPVIINTIVFWDVMMYTLAEPYQYFGKNLLSPPTLKTEIECPFETVVIYQITRCRILRAANLFEFKILPAVINNCTIFWDVTPCSLVEPCRHFGEVYLFLP